MIRAFVEVSGEAPPLARAEAVAAAQALSGGEDPGDPLATDRLIAVSLPDLPAARALAARLGLAHRCLVARASGGSIGGFLEAGDRARGTAAVRRLGRPTSGSNDGAVLAAGDAIKRGGGRISLSAPDRRYWLAAGPAGEELLEEIAPVDRRSASGRRMPLLPFQRPVGLPPRLARAAANLARVRPGDRVLDPFVGTGALLAEAGLLGARLFGIDRDPEMVRGSLRNLAHFGLSAEALLVGDAGAAEFDDPSLRFDAIVTDPPYGRASGTGGEGATEVVARVLPRWAARIRSGGRAVVIVPGPIPPPGTDWSLIDRVAVRVHKSLTREFHVFERT